MWHRGVIQPVLEDRAFLCHRCHAQATRLKRVKRSRNESRTGGGPHARPSCNLHISVQDVFFPRLLERYVQPVVFHGSHCAVAEFLVEHSGPNRKDIRACWSGCSQAWVILARRATTGNRPVKLVAAITLASRANTAEPICSTEASGSSSMNLLGILVCQLAYIRRFAA